MHNGIIPIKIKGPVIKGHIAYLISDQDSKRVKTPTYTPLTVYIISKEKHMLMSNYTKNTSPSTKGNM